MGSECVDALVKAMFSSVADRKHYNIQCYDLLGDTDQELLTLWSTSQFDNTKIKGAWYGGFQPNICRPGLQYAKNCREVVSCCCAH